MKQRHSSGDPVTGNAAPMTFGKYSRSRILKQQIVLKEIFNWESNSWSNVVPLSSYYPILRAQNEMSRSGTSVIRFAKSQVVIKWQGSIFYEMLSSLFADHHRLVSSVSPIPQFCLTIEEPDREYCVTRSGHLLYRGTSEDVAIEMIFRWINHDIADSCESGLLFHAAAVSSRQGNGILLPGNSGAGKSTLAAYLTGQRYNYLTDEIAWVPTPNTEIHGFNLPIHLKPPFAENTTLDVFFSDNNKSSDKTFRSHEGGIFVNATRLNPENVYGTPEIQFIVFPQYRPSTETAFNRLSKAKTCIQLAKHLVNARNLPNNGMPDIIRLTRKIPAYTLIYDKLETALAEVESLVN
jgi:hypothetical protein